MKRLIVLLVFALSAFGATEHPVSDITLQTPPESRVGPWLATNGDAYLAVWQDWRENATRLGLTDAQPSLFAARVNAAGEVLDPTGILLTSASGGPAHVIWNGERYLVFFPIGRTLMLASVESNGNATQYHPVLENAADVSVATNGSRIVIAYEGDRASVLVPPRPYIAVLDLDGFLITSTSVASHRSEKLQPSVVATKEGEFVVAWNVTTNNAYTLTAIRLGSSGERRTFDPVAIGTSGGTTSLYPNGDAFVAIGTSASWGVSADLAQVSAASTGTNGTIFQLQDRAAVAWASSGRVFISRVDANGRIGTPIEAGTTTRSISRVAALQNDGRLFIAWDNFGPSRFANAQLVGTIANAESPLLSPIRGPFDLTVSAPPQFDPAIASGATESLVAWSEPDGIYAARIDDAGRRLDGRGIRLSDVENPGPPRVVFHGGRYAVAFAEDDEIVVRFVTPDGAVQHDAVHVAAPGRQRVALASGGGTLLVGWSMNEDVVVTRIHPSLTTDPPVILSNEVPHAAVDPAAAWNGTGFLVAWTDTYELDRTTVRGAVFARRVTPELGLDGATIALAQPVPYAGPPVVASDGQDWFVAWETMAYFFASDIALRRVPAAGDAGPQTIIGSGNAPELVWTGSSLLVAYRPAGGALVVAPAIGIGTTETIPGRTRNTAAGVVGSGWPFFAQSGITWRKGRWLAVYQRLGDGTAGFVPRVFAATAAGPAKRRVIR